MGSVITFDGAGINKSQVPCGGDIEELVVVVDVEREVVAINEWLMPSGENDEAPLA